MRGNGYEGQDGEEGEGQGERELDGGEASPGLTSRVYFGKREAYIETTASHVANAPLGDDLAALGLLRGSGSETTPRRTVATRLPSQRLLFDIAVRMHST